MRKQCDGVFEGGGVKGIGFVGAVKVLEHAGYDFQNVVGTSAGAIVSSLIAAGYDALELEEVMRSLNYKKLNDKNWLRHVGFLGDLINLVHSYGIHPGDYLESFMEECFRRKNKTRFGDLRTGSKNEAYEYRFQAIASDLTDNRMLILPRDLRDFGIDPDEFLVSKAVRMSMSIPFYYKPFRLQDRRGREHLIADGGLLSNYPIWLLDDGTLAPPWPTFGFKFIDAADARGGGRIDNVVDYGKSVVSTLLQAHDKFHISESKGDFQRTIAISTSIPSNGTFKAIGTTDFDLTEEERELLFRNGERAAIDFLNRWDFSAWVKAYRSTGGRRNT